MRKMSAEEIRRTWLSFFKEKGHHIEPSSSLIPKNDPTLLWINAGVAALKRYFDGSEIPPCRRITNVQKSLRTNDIEHVGYTDRHHTFFEMMGNFSIGDYFKKDAINYGFELLTSPKYFGMDKDKLYITYFPDDLEAKQYWMDNGIEESHLIPLSGNFWEIGEGPCGPDSEIFYDRGEKYDPQGLGIKLLKEDMENDRYIEIWNIVFSQFNSENGKKRSEYRELPSKNIDTGAGLERFACIMQETESNFETDLFWPIITQVEELSGKDYWKNKTAFRIIADHVRSCTFALADGEMFSNEGRGYVLRRLIRRAERYGRVLSLNKPFLYLLVPAVIKIMSPFYPYLNDKGDFISKTIKAEEEKFIRTLSNGESLLKEMIAQKHILPGSDVFKLYDTFGFPKELTLEICQEQGVEVDVKGFENEMKAQKERARKARGELQSMNKQSEDLLAFTSPSTFSYEETELEGKVIGLFVDGKKVETLSGEGFVIFDHTPFYAESGGQVSDTGEITSSNCSGKVLQVYKAPHKQHLHQVNILFGEIKVGDVFTLKVDSVRRTAIMKNHSSVHLLQAALTKVLGPHIAQHGSYVSDEYIHFDFSHPAKMSEEEITSVEKMVNEWIALQIKGETKVLPIEEAKKIGARALFDDKYGDVVRVVCFGDISKEFCGGTHVKNTGDIGVFAIENEESIASGVRRIEARTSFHAYQLFKKRENLLLNITKAVGSTAYSDTPSRVNSLINERASLKKELQVANNKLVTSLASSLKKEIVNNNQISTLVKVVKGDRSLLINLIDTLKQNLTDYAFFFLGDDASIPLVASLGGLALKKYQAGQLVREVVSVLHGSGGGRNDLASGAGKDISKLQEAYQKAKDLLK